MAALTRTRAEGLRCHGEYTVPVHIRIQLLLSARSQAQVQGSLRAGAQA